MKRNTIQKQVVFETFSDLHNHPSAGMVYEAVKERFPNISQATVYRLLAEAAEEGSIQRLKLCHANDRYDVTVADHHHVVCRNCGAVADADVQIAGDWIADQAVPYEDFTIESCHLEFVGLCTKCRNSENKSN